jgi:DNA-directed RNA polymerase specialized sigma24 family protein
VDGQAVMQGGDYRLPAASSLASVPKPCGTTPSGCTQLLALDEALQRLATRDARAAQVVEMRFFDGMEIHEIADILDISERSVKRD